MDYSWHQKEKLDLRWNVKKFIEIMIIWQKYPTNRYGQIFESYFDPGSKYEDLKNHGKQVLIIRLHDE